MLSMSEATSETTTPEQLDSGAGAAAGSAAQVQTPEFAPLSAEPGPKQGPEFSRFHDVQVALAAELGRTKVPIQKLLNIGPGSVVELNRAISSPVELIAQGVPLANGEVVVVNDCFAIRILEVYSGTMSAMQSGG
jgi:flagellar motor switch protein FliN/FliY